MLVNGLGSILLLASAQATPAAPQAVVYNPPVVDSERMKVATSVAAKLMPPGTFRQTIGAPLNLSAAALTHQILMTPVATITYEIGAEAPSVGPDGLPVAKSKILEILDPHSRKRSEAIYAVVVRVAGDAAHREEPKVREAIARAYGQRLSLPELRDVDRFLGTRSGAAYARIAISIRDDLGVYAAIQATDRAVLGSMPEMLKLIAAKTSDLPAPKTAAQLTDAERRNIAALMGVEPIDPKPNR